MKKLYSTILFVQLCALISAQTPIAHYSFDNTLNDETGNWNLTASSGFTPTFETGHNGISNGAVSGFAAADFLSTSGNFIPLEGDQDRTITAWIKTTEGGNQSVAGLGNYEANFQKFTFGGAGANGGADSRNRGEVQGNGVSGAFIDTGNWEHIAVTYSGGVVTLYINGAVDTTRDLATQGGNNSSTIATAANPLLIGNDYSLTNEGDHQRGWKGAIDDVRIFDSALTQPQIQTIYDNALSTNDVELETVNIYPNPIRDHLQLSGSRNVQSIEVYNILGAKVLSKTVIERNSLDVSFLSNGIYLVKCFNREENVVASLKIVKQDR